MIVDAGSLHDFTVFGFPCGNPLMVAATSHEKICRTVVPVFRRRLTARKFFRSHRNIGTIMFPCRPPPSHTAVQTRIACSSTICVAYTRLPSERPMRTRRRPTADGTEPKEMDLRNLNPNSIRIAAEANVEDPGSVGHTRLLEHAQQGVELLGKDVDRLDSYGPGDHDHIYTQHGPQPSIRIRDLKSVWPFWFEPAVLREMADEPMEAFTRDLKRSAGWIDGRSIHGPMFRFSNRRTRITSEQTVAERSVNFEGAWLRLHDERPSRCDELERATR